MIYSAHQPNYFPYLGLFYKIYKSDIFVFLDDVQFTKTSGPAHDRNIISRGEETRYLKVPVIYRFKNRINEVKINPNIDWVSLHLAYIENCYFDAPYYEEIRSDLENILRKSYDNLAELNMALIQMICEKSGMNTRFIKSSDYQITSTKTDRLIKLGKYIGGTEYLSGTGAKCYMDVKKMESAGIKVTYSDYVTALYDKREQKCLKNMSVLDYLFYYGYDFSKLGW